MPDQLTFFGPDPPPMPTKPSKRPREPRKKHQFFYAILPPPEVTASLTELRYSLCKKFGLQGTPVTRHRLHITLHPLPEYGVFPHDRIKLFCGMASAIRQKPFRVTFDVAKSFSPVVLVPGATNGSLMELERALEVSLVEAGFTGQWSFNPHITLLYTEQKVPDQYVDPVTWTVGEFALIHSVHGETTHNLLERFPLCG